MDAVPNGARLGRTEVTGSLLHRQAQIGVPLRLARSLPSGCLQRHRLGWLRAHQEVNQRRLSDDWEASLEILEQHPAESVTLIRRS